jgi:hypothetical protein
MINNKHFSRFRNRFSRLRKHKKKELPLWVQWISALSGLASLLLAIYLLFQKTQIEKMETLLENQQKQTVELISLNSKQQLQTEKIIRLNEKQDTTIDK